MSNSISRDLLTNLFGAIILIVRLAHLAVQACPNLGTHPNTISNLNRRHFIAHFDCLADDFVANAKR